MKKRMVVHRRSSPVRKVPVSSSIPFQVQIPGDGLQAVLIASTGESSPGLSWGGEILPLEQANNLPVSAVGSHSVDLAGEMPVFVERGKQALLSRSRRSFRQATPRGLQVQHSHNEDGTVPLLEI